MSDTPRTDAMEREAGLPDFPAFARKLERELAELQEDARRWRALMRAGVTYHESDGKPPVLAGVSKRIWYHATDDTDSTTLAEAMDAYEQGHARGTSK